MTNEEKIIKKLMIETQKTKNKDEVPVGAIITKGNKIIAKAYNRKRTKHGCIYHAEIIAITRASKKLKDWRLNDCSLYVTLYPCKMCQEVIKQSRIKNVYYLLESKFNNESSYLANYVQINDRETTREYKQELKAFFVAKR